LKLIKKLARFAGEPFIEKTESLVHWYWLLKTQLYFRIYFKKIGRRSRIINPLRIKNVDFIAIGEQVLIHKYCWLQAQKISESLPEFSIGNGCIIGNFNHITCVGSVRIEDKVLTADRVFISDHGHEFEDPSIPVMDQGVRPGKPVTIGQGSWLGENVAVISCRIGRNCVVGANSVVLNDIPDHCVAVGAPARVVRRYNPATLKWERGPFPQI
jgi:acetyltransferase-like isoleucine patch superfamily enzyme